MRPTATRRKLLRTTRIAPAVPMALGMEPEIDSVLSAALFWPYGSHSKLWFRPSSFSLSSQLIGITNLSTILWSGLATLLGELLLSTPHVTGTGLPFC